MRTRPESIVPGLLLAAALLAGCETPRPAEVAEPEGDPARDALVCQRFTPNGFRARNSIAYAAVGRRYKLRTNGRRIFVSDLLVDPEERAVREIEPRGEPPEVERLRRLLLRQR